MAFSAVPETDRPPTTAPASAPTDDPTMVHWKEVAQKLASEKFNVREAAQKELDQATYRVRGILAELEKHSTDLEAKSRLVVQIASIDEKMATDPPPISLEVKDATLAEVCDALSRATGVTIEAWPNGGFPPDRTTYSLSRQGDAVLGRVSSIEHAERYWVAGLQGTEIYAAIARASVIPANRFCGCISYEYYTIDDVQSAGARREAGDARTVVVQIHAGG